MVLTQKNWTIEFDSAAQREFERLDKSVALRISKFLHQRVASLENPRLIGERLHGTLSDYWKYRVGDYRIVCSIEHEKLVVVVLRIGHRREIYKR
jgi:mRNA interferase RelE/StbE